MCSNIEDMFSGHLGIEEAEVALFCCVRNLAWIVRVPAKSAVNRTITIQEIAPSVQSYRWGIENPEFQWSCQSYPNKGWSVQWGSTPPWKLYLYGVRSCRCTPPSEDPRSCRCGPRILKQGCSCGSDSAISIAQSLCDFQV